MIQATREVYNNLMDQGVHDQSKEGNVGSKKYEEKSEPLKLLAFLTTVLRGNQKKTGQWSEIKEWRIPKDSGFNTEEG